MKTIVLASTSPYRRELLARLQLPFEVDAPGVDESPLPSEAPRDLALRLARAKADAVAVRYPLAWVIGSDQVAVVDSHRLDKPGNRTAAIAQLNRMQGRQVVFHTALWLRCPPDGSDDGDVVETRVTFRRLTSTEIERYVDRELPYDVAGAAKIESLGVALVERIDGADPTALIGLPLIRLVTMLRAQGFQIPAP